MPNKEVQRLDGAFVYKPHPASYNSYDDDYNYLEYGDGEDYFYGDDYGYDYSDEDYSQEYDNKVGRSRKKLAGKRKRTEAGRKRLVITQVKTFV